MLTATLIARPGRLKPALAENLRNAMGGGDVLWLAPDEAAEFALPARPENEAHLREELALLGTDLCILPTEGREKRLLLADMDSTMIEQECIDELAARAGVGPRVAEITARAMNGELDFEGALRERVGLLEGLDESVIAEVLRDQITLAPGGATLIATMKARGGHTALVSGGFTAFSGPIAAQLGFDRHQANHLLAEDGVLTGKVADPILGREAKVAALEAICAELGITVAEALTVGDGANDLGMLCAAGMGVALHAKPSVAAQAPVRVNHGDLTALLFLQGIARADFVEA